LRDKLRVLKGLLDDLGLGLGNCVAVGDDESMIPIFRAVRLSIAFNPRSQEVARSAHVVVRSDNLRAILPYILKGYGAGRAGLRRSKLLEGVGLQSVRLERLETR